MSDINKKYFYRSLENQSTPQLSLLEKEEKLTHFEMEERILVDKILKLYTIWSFNKEVSSHQMQIDRTDFSAFAPLWIAEYHFVRGLIYFDQQTLDLGCTEFLKAERFFDGGDQISRKLTAKLMFLSGKLRQHLHTGEEISITTLKSWRKLEHEIKPLQDSVLSQTIDQMLKRILSAMGHNPKPQIHLFLT